MDDLIYNAMPDPVVLINSQRKIFSVNSAARDLIGNVFIDEDLSLTFRHPDILSLADEALQGDTTGKIEVDFSHPVPRSFEISATNVAASGSDNEALQVLLMFHDITAIRSAENFRSDFIANLSHELRSPLVSLIGFLETLEDMKDEDAETRDRFYGIMSGEAHRMKALIDDLLTLSKIEANEHIRPQGEVNLALLLKTVIEPLSHKALNKSISIEFQTGENVPIIPGDSQELIQIFTNLINNAINYGNSDSVVKVEIKSVNRIPDIGRAGVCVSVNNFGDVIAPEHLPRLTQRFYRIDKGRSRSVGGTGLGLAIVKHLVRHHRGKLGIESEAEKGTTFSVFLPI